MGEDEVISTGRSGAASGDTLTLFMSRTEIAGVVARLAGRLREDYEGKDPVLVGVLRGSFMFLADLVRALEFPLEVDFLRASSYDGATTTGHVQLTGSLASDVRNRHVLVVEDVVDTGLTTARVLEDLRRRGPASLAVCALLDKPSRRRVSMDPRYVGVTVPDQFLVGYGLDHNQRYRNLPDLCILSHKIP